MRLREVSVAPSGARGTYAAALISITISKFGAIEISRPAGIVACACAHALDSHRRIAALRPEA